VLDRNDVVAARNRLERHYRMKPLSDLERLILCRANCFALRPQDLRDNPNVNNDAVRRFLVSIKSLY
jgi:hypothetical protein